MGIVVLPAGLALEAALAAAREKSCRLLLFSEIVRWEDRATEWSGVPDVMEVRVQAVSVEDGGTLSEQLLRGEGPMLTFGGHPEDLLAKPIGSFVQSVNVPASRVPVAAVSSGTGGAAISPARCDEAVLVRACLAEKAGACLLLAKLLVTGGWADGPDVSLGSHDAGEWLSRGCKAGNDESCRLLLDKSQVKRPALGDGREFGCAVQEAVTDDARTPVVRPAEDSGRRPVSLFKSDEDKAKQDCASEVSGACVVLGDFYARGPQSPASKKLMCLAYEKACLLKDNRGCATFRGKCER